MFYSIVMFIIVGFSFTGCSKNEDKNTSAITLTGSGGIQVAVDNGLDPSVLEVKLYRFFVSTSPLCTNPKLVIDRSTNSEYLNILGSSSNFGSGRIDNGTYPCVMLEISDNIKFMTKESSDSGNCIPTVTSSLGICSNGDPITSIDGSKIACTEGEDTIVLYLSTAFPENGDAFNPPETDSGEGVLEEALVVEDDVTSVFVVDGSGKVEDTGTACEMSPPIFSFVKN